MGLFDNHLSPPDPSLALMTPMIQPSICLTQVFCIARPPMAPPPPLPASLRDASSDEAPYDDDAKIADCFYEINLFSFFFFLSVAGSLQIWYHLQTDQRPDVFSPALNNLADGRLHRIRIHRVGRNLYVQVSAGRGESRESKNHRMTWLEC